MNAWSLTRIGVHMDSTMQDFPLTVTGILRHGTTWYSGRKAITKTADGYREISFGELGGRVGEEVPAGLGALGVRVADVEDPRSRLGVEGSEERVAAGGSDGRRGQTGVPARVVGRLRLEVEVLPVPGASPGEIALKFGQIVCVGDAVIHLPDHGFALLPDNYCTDAKLLRQSLRNLLRWEFTILTFAHGLPLTTQARGRLASLLD